MKIEYWITEELEPFLYFWKKRVYYIHSPFMKWGPFKYKEAVEHRGALDATNKAYP